ncbi:hypothetical protein HGP28_03840 [Vibrio sp. SM6]|uniref:Phosphate ABC transporter substrate-binding protein n=1 Tax=Vibrio agarilyticus TaxID=2726741 RepID=A0A7X8YFK5_9VIBR|nr:hypothetical protein [Vibrio agarilyticus]NLS12023.1 hypothetical protein [Vibrio agarilyticus]
MKTTIRQSIRYVTNTCCIVGLALFASYSAASWSTEPYISEDYVIFTLDAHFSELNKSKARKLFRGKTKRLDGNKFELADWPKNSLVREDFYQALLGKNLAQMNAYWAALSFSGKARPPKELKGDNINALLTWMAAEPNRIGYAPLTKVPTDATVLFRLEVGNQ